MPLTLHRHATANACADAGSTGESDSTPLRDYAWNVKLACRKDTVNSLFRYFSSLLR
jgi:hypothetical protein